MWPRNSQIDCNIEMTERSPLRRRRTVEPSKKKKKKKTKKKKKKKKCVCVCVCVYIYIYIYSKLLYISLPKAFFLGTNTLGHRHTVLQNRVPTSVNRILWGNSYGIHFLYSLAAQLVQ
jgi:glycopeptide antibiotics resistance protein